MADRRKGRAKRASPRSKSGRLSRAYQTVARDNSTQEVQAKREQLINGSPVELIASSAGILFARGLLRAEHYRAADGSPGSQRRCSAYRSATARAAGH
jgi:hypothetical protein